MNVDKVIYSNYNILYNNGKKMICQLLLMLDFFFNSIVGWEFFFFLLIY